MATATGHHNYSPFSKGVISGPASPAMAGPIIRPVRAIFEWLIECYQSHNYWIINNYCLNY